MSPKERSSRQREDRKERWLRSGEHARARPWAYEQLLFGSTRELDAVVEELDKERQELARFHRELDEHLARIARLERRLKELTPVTGREEPRPVPSRTVLPSTHVAPVDKDELQASDARRSHSLARCEGFEVDSPSGPVGFVEGLRFLSRIDQPDLLEVRGGRFGRQLLLIPIEQVEDIQVTEERVLVSSSAATVTSDYVGDLVDRFRRTLRFHQHAS